MIQLDVPAASVQQHAAGLSNDAVLALQQQTFPELQAVLQPPLSVLSGDETRVVEEQHQGSGLPDTWEG